MGNPVQYLSVSKVAKPKFRPDEYIHRTTSRMRKYHPSARYRVVDGYLTLFSEPTRWQLGVVQNTEASTLNNRSIGLIGLFHYRL